MKSIVFFLCMLAFVLVYGQKENNSGYVIVVHGGAGYSTPENTTQEKQEAYKAKLTEALQAGQQVLEKGGTAVDAVVAVISILEDSPLFNAGKGAVFTGEGTNELDASIMDGETLNAGAVAGVTIVKNPIMAAREVMYNSRHVMLSGKGACTFAKQQLLEIVDPEYFFTEDSWNELQRVKESEEKAAKSKHGTVGCVVLDKKGNLAAGTSTGGMTNKKFGRIGDSPVIGAGTYADNNTCAVSCTGHGEYYIRYAVAHDMSARMAYLGQPVDSAAKVIIHNILKPAGGNGGLIAVDKNGNIAMEFNTPCMFRGYVRSDGEIKIELFR